MNKYLIGILLSLASLSALGSSPATAAARHDVKIQVKINVTLEHAQKLINLFEQQGPEAINVYVKWLEDLKSKGYIRSYHVDSYSCDKTGGTTMQCSFDAQVCVNPAASKECKYLLETLIKNKSNLKMVHKAVKQEFDYSSSHRSAEIKKWLGDLKKGIASAILLGQFSYNAQPDPNNPICIALNRDHKFGAYLYDQYGCHVKINDFKCEMVK